VESVGRLEMGTLWGRLIDRTHHAITSGTLLTIPTECDSIEQNGVRFIVRILSNLVRKDEDQKKRSTASPGKDFNPFLPYEEDLFVADLSDTHLCLLNKFNVVDHHLLIITRAFEEQENWLNLADFVALWMTLLEIDGLAFYNGGKDAGASQRHKHLQLVPLPLAPGAAGLPIEPLIASADFQGTVGQSPTLPFRHAIALLPPPSLTTPTEAAIATLDLYLTLLQALGFSTNGTRQSGAYNLLMTRRWMMVVPRSQESYEAIAVNSLGFAGALLVRNADQLQRLQELQPLTLLKHVGY
jgi:sulfate adenylyltransferase (ADP) / ATP adenylyltransferase